MKKALKILLPALFIALILFTAVISGASDVKKTVEYKLSYKGEVLFSSTYECRSAAAFKIVLLYGGSPERLYKKAFLGDPICFFGYLNEHIVSDVVTAVHSVEREAKESEVYFDGKEFSYLEGASGIKSDDVAVMKALAENGHAEIEVTEIFPEESVEDLKARTAEASSAVTLYGRSSAERKKNIELAARKINGVCVQPGETFSFNETVGKRTKENGFFEAKVIVGGEYTDGIGGGVCQVSSTLYNAWLKAGLDVSVSRPHSLKPSYITPGLDAMVSDKSDLVLFNGGGYPVYIGAEADGVRLTVKTFTKPIGCKIRLGSELIRTLPCEEYDTVIGEDEEILSYPTDGSVYRSYREYTENGEVYAREYLRTSSYLPIKGIMQIGSGRRVVFYSSE